MAAHIYIYIHTFYTLIFVSPECNKKNCTILSVHQNTRGKAAQSVGIEVVNLQGETEVLNPADLQ